MREDKRNESKKIILFVAITMAVFFLFPVYAYTQIGRGIERREALRAEIETHGPWVEQAIWMSADGGAYVLPPSDEPYAQPTAYFLISGEWYDFEMICGPGLVQLRPRAQILHDLARVVFYPAEGDAVRGHF